MPEGSGPSWSRFRADVLSRAGVAALLRFLGGKPDAEMLAASVEVPCLLGWAAALLRKPGPAAETDGKGSLWHGGGEMTEALIAISGLLRMR